MPQSNLRVSELELFEDGWLLRFNGDYDEFTAMLAEMKQHRQQGVRWKPNAFGIDRGGWFVPNSILFEYRHQFYNFDAMLQSVKDKYTAEQQPPPRQEPPPKQPPKAPEISIPKTIDEAFAILSLPSTASLATIKTTYHTLAHSWHPDHGGDTFTMAALNEAYKIALQHIQEREQ